MEQRVVREVAGVVRTPEVLEKVVDAVELNGFDRADIDVMADVETIRKRSGAVFVPVKDFADAPQRPTRRQRRAGLGALAARHLGRDRAKLIETTIMEGGLVVWVRVRTEEAERQAEQIMRDGGAEAVRVHEIALDKRLSDLPLAGIVGDEVSGCA